MSSSAASPAIDLAGDQGGSLRQPVLLVVDDDEAINELIEIWFGGLGWEVRAACSGPEGVARANVHQPDVVLLDLMLPGYGGLDVLRRLRLLGSDAVVVLTSGWDAPEERAAAMVAGAADYVVKPFSLRDLERRLQELLSVRDHQGSPTP